jgi:2-phosphosulfolactate phosphatase
MTEWFAQNPYGVRFEWGLAGTAALASSSSCLVIVDVLSFTTAVTVAAEAGTEVFPCLARRERRRLRPAAPGAAGRRPPGRVARLAVVAVAGGAAPCPFTPRLVLPSPNGSAISSAAASGPATVVAACLRNARAAGAWLTRRSLGTPDRPATVIAAGERWGDGSLRPALEDLLGAGAVIAALHDQGSGPLSPEAEAARAWLRRWRSASCCETGQVAVKRHVRCHEQCR